MCSCALVGLSVTLSGMGFGLCQIMSLRRYQPSACNAKATRQGMPNSCLGFMPGTRFWFGNEPVVLPANQTVDFEKIDSLDALAETLASNRDAYTLNRDRLAHDEGDVYVTYGLGGARIETKKGV